MKHYILKNKKPVEAKLFEWAEWFENTENRRVAYTELQKGYVSTVFIGIGRGGFMSDELFETMAFDTGTELDCEPFRTDSWEEAEKMHKKIIKDISKE